MRGPKGAAAMWANLEQWERAQLAQAYITSASTSMDEHPPVLLDLMAQRMTGRQLAEVSQHFGYEPVYSALWRQAADKSAEFEQNADVNARGPAPHGDLGRGGFKKMQFKAGVFMTLREIYLGFRSQPGGSGSITNALYETAMFAGGRLGAAYYGGHEISKQYLLPYIQQDHPDRYEALGANVSYLMNGFTNILTTPLPESTTTSLLGNLQATSAGSSGFSLLPQDSYMLQMFGGDFGVVTEWYSLGATTGGLCTQRCFYSTE